MLVWTLAPMWWTAEIQDMSIEEKKSIGIELVDLDHLPADMKHFSLEEIHELWRKYNHYPTLDR